MKTLKTCWTLSSFVIAATLLTACATPIVVSEPLCPPLVEYDQAERDQLADELDAAPADAFWPAATVDYLNLRSRIRAVCDPEEEAIEPTS